MTTPTSSARSKPLPIFEPGFNFQVAAARFDRMEITVELGILPTNIQSEVHSFFRRIARGRDVFSLDGSNDYPTLLIRKRKWLFEGELRASPHPAGDHSTVKAVLTINPTRYYAHQKTRERYRKRNDNPHLDELMRVEAVSAELRGRSLDGNDNYIPEPFTRQASRIDWYGYTERLVRKIVKALQYELRRRSEGVWAESSMRLTRADKLKWTIRQTEIYWEYAHPNATAAVERFGEAAIPFFKRSRREIYNNSTGYRFSTGKADVWNTIYAKLPERIRIECTFTKYPKSLFTGDSRYKLSRYKRESLGDFERCLTALCRAAKDSAERLSTIRAGFGSNPQPNLEAVSSQLLQIIKHGEYSAGFLEKLLHAIFFTGKISGGEEVEEKRIFSKLLRRGLLEIAGRKKRGEPQVYTISGELRTLQQWLHSRRSR